MSIAKQLEELADLERPVTASSLAQLSGLMDAELAEFTSWWSDLATERRRLIIAEAVDLADENPEIDYYSVFCHAMVDPDAVVRERAVSGLWESEDRASIPKLIGRLREDDAAEVRAAAAMVLGHFAVLAAQGKLLQRDGDRVHEALMRTLQDEQEPLTVRRRALESVGAFTSPEVQRWIQWGYQSDEALLRQSALFAMGRNCDATWVSIVLKELQSTDPAMRYEAANAACELGEEETVPQLVALVRADPELQVQLAAIRALGSIGGAAARKALREFAKLADEDAVRDAAQEVLQMMELEASDVMMMKFDRL